MVIQISNFVESADTAEQGALVYVRIRDALHNGERIEVSFQGVKTATSAFANTCFVQLLSDWSFDEIKSRIRIVNSTAQIDDMIRSCLQRKAMALAILKVP